MSLFLWKNTNFHTLIWTYIKVPTVWLHSSINCLKGLMRTAANYRGLSIGANMSRMLDKVILNRFQKAYKTHMSKTQFGFRQNRSTFDGIFIAKMVTEKVVEPILTVYIYLTAVYDHIPRDFLVKVIDFTNWSKTPCSNYDKKCMRVQQLPLRSKTVFDELVG